MRLSQKLLIKRMAQPLFWAERMKRKLNGYPSPHHNHASGVYIINFARNCISSRREPCISSTRSVAYHQHKVLYLIKPQEMHLR